MPATTDKRLSSCCKCFWSISPGRERPWGLSHIRGGEGWWETWGPFFRKRRKRFGPGKPFWINLYLKTESCIRPKRFLWREPFVKILWMKQRVITRFEILLRLSGDENVLGPSRNGHRFVILFKLPKMQMEKSTLVNMRTSSKSGIKSSCVFGFSPSWRRHSATLDLHKF